MKEAYILLIIFTLHLTTLYTPAIQLKPVFKDYCPDEYYHKEFITKKDVKKPIPQVFVIAGFAAFAIPGFLFNMYNNRTRNVCVEIVNSNIQFWKIREEAFEKRLKECEISKDVVYCYSQLADRELQARTMFEQSQAINRSTISNWYR